MKNKLLMRLLLLPALLVFGSAAIAQVTVSGNVSDALGPVPGVNIIVKGTPNGAQSDFDGNYSLDNVASDATLVFSYIGYATQEVAVNGQTTINVTLQDDVQALNEVVVIGYGTTTVKDATGAVASVTSEDFNQGVILSPEQLIQGKTAGVQISQSTGEPGAGIEIRIRGANSVRSNNNPLFVVDGVPLSGEATQAENTNIGTGSSGARNPLSFLNPNDIESISILKDASAAAIYGSRGANGVVLITTKSGRGSTGGRWDLNSTMSMSKVRKTFDLLGADEYLNQTANFGFDVASRDFGGSTDWQEFIYRTAVSTDQNLGYSNNYGDGNVRATFGYGKLFGVVENTSLERITGRVNANHKFFDDKLRLSFQGTLSRVNDEGAATGASAGFRGDLIGAAYSANPTWPTFPTFEGTGGLLSPATALEFVQNTTNTNRFLMNFSAEYDIIPELTAKATFGYDTSDSEKAQVASALARNFDQGAFGNGVGAYSELETENRLFEATLTWNKQWDKVKINVLGGYSWQDFNRRGFNAQAFGFNTIDLNEMVADMESTIEVLEGRIGGEYQQYGFAPNISEGIFINRLGLDNRNEQGRPQPTTDFILNNTGLQVRSLFNDYFDNTDELQSFFGRAEVEFNDKYLLTATMRADGSSRFGGNNQYGYFPSGAFAWKIHNEDFIGDSVSTLKLRLGVGITGNQEGLGYGNFARRQRYTGGDVISDGGDINRPGIADVAFDNEDLKWEETLQYAAGIDFGFNNDRFYGSVDVYRKETSDLLFRVLSAQPAVQPFVFLNLPDSKVVNQGIEFAIGADIVDTGDWNWNVDFNISYNQNEITDLQGEFDAGTIRGQGLSLAFAQKLKAGQPLFSYFLRDFQGFDPVTGQPIQTDVQDFVGKSALPDINTGLSTRVSYKNWTFAAYFAGQFGHYIYNNTANAFFTAGAFRSGRNVPLDVLQTGESFDAAADVSTRFLESGDFVRLQNVTLSYDIPLSDDSVFDRVGVSLTGQNVFVITDYSGLDPEVSSSPGGGDLLNGLPVFGIDYAAYPRPTTYTLGLTANF
jgi:iron complex outermembrane receptor protein